MNRPVHSSTSVGFHIGRGSALRLRSSRAFASATERIPSLTSCRTSRGSLLRRWLPAASSAASSAGVHRRRCTASAIADRTWSRLPLRRLKSSTARGSGASGQCPGTGSGSRVVRSTSTNP